MSSSPLEQGMELQHLYKQDLELAKMIARENKRQHECLEMIASENYCSKATREAQGSILTNKYAEGLPQKRYYGGCEFVDQIETLANERLRKLFDVKWSNVQPHSGSQANMAAYQALIKPGDKILALSLNDGGHLTHGSPVNFSGKLYEAHFYGLDPKTELIDMNDVESKIKSVKPALLVVGASAYSRTLHFDQFGELAKAHNIPMLVDMAHIAGLIAAKVHPSPINHADVITSTTHKTLRGPRSGVIMSNNEELWKKFDSSVFPGMQGGPLEHVIAAKACAFLEALDESFVDYQKQVLTNAKTLENVFHNLGVEMVTGGTDNHLLLLKTDHFKISGKEAEHLLDQVGITTNKNMIPGDQRSPFVTSGIRIGTPALTTRGMKENEMKQIAHWIHLVLSNPHNEDIHKEIKAGVRELCSIFPTFLEKRIYGS